LLGSGPFVVLAGDILCDFPLGRLAPPPDDILAHLVMVDNPDHHPLGDFAIEGGRLQISGEPKWTFSGIGVYQPELFQGLGPGRRALRPVFEAAIAAGKLSGSVHRGYWSDVGTAERLAEAQHSPMVSSCAAEQRETS